MYRFLLPLAGLGIVATIATVLIGVIVLRSPDTHGNLWETIPSDYRRTPLETLGHGGSHLALALEPRAGGGETSEGRALYLGHGCATCHGINAEGGPVGPSLAGSSSSVVKHMVREGPGGMTAHSEKYLSEADLDRIVAYLEGLKAARSASEEIATLQRLTWDPLVPRELLLKGKAAIRRSCGACHTQPGKEDILRAFGSDAEAARLVADMVYETNLNLEDARAIAYYMLAIRNGADPVKTP